MSRNVFVTCTECKNDSDDLNRGEDLFQIVYQHREAIAVLREASKGEIDISIMGRYDIVNFIIDHKDHTLLMKDEYGYTYDWQTLERSKPDA